MIASFINRGHARTVKAKKNILASLLIKGCSIAINLWLVPLTIHYVNTGRYGVWLTLSSVIAWLSFFDIGFGNGLRNKFAEAMASGQKELSRVYVSTTYAILAIIIALVFCLFLCINPFLHWPKILNATPDFAGEFTLLALVVVGSFCLQFILQLVNTLLISDQKPAQAGLLGLLGNTISLAIIFTLTVTTRGNLLYLGLALGFSPVLVLFLASLWLFNSTYKYFKPSWKFVRFSYAKDLMNLGVKFFIIQISAIVIFQTDSIIIAQLFGPKEVTPYNIAYKFQGLPIMVYSIIITPFWSAFTEAWAKKDTAWIKATIQKLQRIWLIFTGLTILQLVCAPFIYRIWLGDAVYIPYPLSASMALYSILLNWNSIYVQFLNGVGKIKFQLYIGILGMILIIPLTIYFGKVIGITGIILATCVMSVLNTTWTYLQYKKLIENKATGIWNQ